MRINHQFAESSDVFGRMPSYGSPFACHFAEEGEGGGGGTGGDGSGSGSEGDERYTKAVSDAKRYRKRAQDAEAALKAAQAAALTEDDRAEFERLQAEASQREEANLAQKGEFDELRSRLVAQHEKATAAKDKIVQGLTEQLRTVLATDALKTALAARGVKAVDQAAYLLSRQIQVEIADGRATVSTLDTDGSPLVDAEGAPGATVPIPKLVETWLASDGAHFLPASGDTGSGAHQAGSDIAGPTLAELDADSAKMSAFIAEHGTEAVNKLIREAKAAERRSS